jgi:hypothetical protein
MEKIFTNSVHALRVELSELDREFHRGAKLPFDRRVAWEEKIVREHRALQVHLERVLDAKALAA